MTDNQSPQPAQKYRLPIINSAEGINGLSHLSSEEKELGMDNLKKIPPSDGWFLLANDPEAQAFYAMTEQGILNLLAPDTQFDPGSPMTLSCLLIGRLMNCEWMVGCMSFISVKHIELWGTEDFKAEQIGMLDFPDADCWTAEQSLTLKFTRACVEHTMTDEVFAQAREMWGDKRLIRMIIWFGFCQTWVMLQNSTGMKFESDAVPEGGIPKQAVPMLHAKTADTWKGYMSIWAKQTPFPGPPGS